MYISHQARGDSDSGEHSPADSQGVDIHPGPALRKARSLEHLDFEAAGGPESREHSPAKLCGTSCYVFIWKSILIMCTRVGDRCTHDGDCSSPWRGLVPLLEDW